jgi:putative addiction module killer protein
MVLIRKTNLFMKWLTGLRDQKAIARIQIRIDRLALGNPGDVHPVGSGISEMSIDYGPGYRVYFSQRGSDLVILLCGGDKTTQTSDIEKAKRVNEGVQ